MPDPMFGQPGPDDHIGHVLDVNRAAVAVGPPLPLLPAPDPANPAARFFLPCRPPLPPAPASQPFFPLF